MSRAKIAKMFVRKKARVEKNKVERNYLVGLMELSYYITVGVCTTKIHLVY